MKQGGSLLGFTINQNIKTDIRGARSDQWPDLGSVNEIFFLHKKVSLRAFATQSRSMLYQNSILACFTLFAKTDCLLLLKIRSQNLAYCNKLNLFAISAEQIKR